MWAPTSELVIRTEPDAGSVDLARTAADQRRKLRSANAQASDYVERRALCVRLGAGGLRRIGAPGFLAVASRSSQSLSSCRSAGDRALGAWVSRARRATACTATRSAAGASSGPSFGASAEAGTVTTASIASR